MHLSVFNSKNMQLRSCNSKCIQIVNDFRHNKQKKIKALCYVLIMQIIERTFKWGYSVCKRNWETKCDWLITSWELETTKGRGSSVVLEGNGLGE